MSLADDMRAAALEAQAMSGSVAIHDARLILALLDVLEAAQAMDTVRLASLELRAALARWKELDT